MAIRLSALLLLFVTTPAFGQSGVPEPSLSIALQREAVVTRDTVRGELWIGNPSGQPIDSLRLHLSAPPFVHVGSVRSDECVDADGTLRLDRIPANDILHTELCLFTDGELVEGDYTIAFSLIYRTPPSAGAAARTGYTQLSKPLRAGVFGNDTIGGTSLRLAAFLIPGLLFFILLRWMRADTDRLLKGPEVVTASVIVSILLIFATARAAPSAYRGGMSLGRFAFLCLAAALLALAVAASAAAVRRYRQRHLVWSSDSDAMKFLRLLRALSPLDARLRGWSGASGRVVGMPVTVKQKDGTVLYGTMAEEYRPGEVRVLGWLRAGPVSDPALKARLDRLAERKDWYRVARLLHGHRVQTDVQSAVHVRDSEGMGSDFGSTLEVLASECVSVRKGIHEGQLPANIAGQPVISIT